MREPCIRDLQVSGIVGHDDQFAELAAGLANGEQRGAHPPPGRALLLCSGGHRPSGLGRGCLYPIASRLSAVA
jgi:hypothetical protein